ncbi:MAG TPA: FGGY family carbohydrate kinase [Microlunatus sp.]|nr:FGGY family carbohydrate kinase [Microlunatus sp.]
MTQILAIDQGTTNSKAVLVDTAGAVRAVGSVPVRVSHPRPGWVEQDAEQLWRSVLEAVDGCLSAIDPDELELSGLALSTQRESVVVWDRRTGEPLGPVIGWQDVRTAGWCRECTGPGDDDLVRRRTGLRIDAMFSAPKIGWLLRESAVRRARSEVCVGTIDSWLVWRLTGGRRHVIEAGNASRTLLFDVVDLHWGAELLELFDVPGAVLPEVLRSDGDFGDCRSVAGLPDGLPIAAVLADSHAALLGHGCTAGTAKATYGTGTSVMTPTADFVPGFSPVPSTLAWLTDRPTYAREGNILSSGATLAWAAGLLGTGVAELLALAGTVDGAGGVTLVPAFTGLGAPHWDRDVRGVITQLDADTGPARVARAAVEAVAHQVCDVVEVIDADTIPLHSLRADGGATASELLMQTQADLLGRPVEVADLPEVSALGAAELARRRLGGEPAPRPAARVFEPSLSSDEREVRRSRWRDEVSWLRSRPRSGG